MKTITFSIDLITILYNRTINITNNLLLNIIIVIVIIIIIKIISCRILTCSSIRYIINFCSWVAW